MVKTNLILKSFVSANLRDPFNVFAVICSMKICILHLLPLSKNNMQSFLTVWKQKMVSIFLFFEVDKQVFKLKHYAMFLIVYIKYVENFLISGFRGKV